MYSSKSVHLATVELCTSCSQKADREGLSLKSEMKFHFCWGGEKVFFLLVWMDSTSSCYSLNSFFFKWRCCSLVLLKSLWQKQVLTTHLSWNHLWGYNLCNVLKHTLTINRVQYHPPPPHSFCEGPRILQKLRDVVFQIVDLPLYILSFLVGERVAATSLTCALLCRWYP